MHTYPMFTADVLKPFSKSSSVGCYHVNVVGIVMFQHQCNKTNVAEYDHICIYTSVHLVYS